jgi:putative transposase
MIFLDYFHNLS